MSPVRNNTLKMAGPTLAGNRYIVGLHCGRPLIFKVKVTTVRPILYPRRRYEFVTYLFNVRSKYHAGDMSAVGVEKLHSVVPTLPAVVCL
jgi:hypothetical protein